MAAAPLRTALFTAIWKYGQNRVDRPGLSIGFSGIVLTNTNAECIVTLSLRATEGSVAISS
jgi:hypothetical protein